VTTPGARPIEVRGGAASISVDFEQLAVLGEDATQLAASLTATAGVAAAIIANPTLIATAVLDPLGAGEVTARASTLAVLCGAAAHEAASLAVALHSAAAAYDAVDRVAARAVPAIQAVTDLPDLQRAWDLRRPVASLGDVLTADPAFVDLGLDLATVSVPFGGVLGTRQSLLGLGRIYPDGHPVLHRTNDAVIDESPPRRLRDLMTALAIRDDDEFGGAIDVRIVESRSADGSIRRSAIVDITGTTAWDPLRRHSPVVSNFATNVRAVAGGPTTYAAGVVMAMRAAGVTADMPVMLVGHSQGGLVAAGLARQYARSSQLRITHVVTAGSPIGMIDLPSSVQALSLENRGDLVVEADAARNRASPSQVTVRVDRGGHGVLARHSLAEAYSPGAADVDASTDRSVRAWLAGASDFMGGDTVRTQTFRVERKP